MSITSVKSGATGISLALDNNFMEPIATTLVGSGGSSNITFNDIPQSYKHLQLRALTFRTAEGNSLKVTYNSDTGNNYARHTIYGNGSSVTASGNATTSFVELGWAGGAATTGGSVCIMDILDYANTNKYKTSRSLFGYDLNNTNGYIVFASGLWQNTNAISSITIIPDNPANGNLNQYSRFSLYGIKG